MLDHETATRHQRSTGRAGIALSLRNGPRFGRLLHSESANAALPTVQGKDDREPTLRLPGVIRGSG